MLKALGFFQRFVQTLFSNAFAIISTNGVLSKPFELQCSTRQGCPLVPTLYVLVADALGYLLANRVVEGTIMRISLPPPSESKLINGHFTDDSFLTGFWRLL